MRRLTKAELRLLDVHWSPGRHCSGTGRRLREEETMRAAGDERARLAREIHERSRRAGRVDVADRDRIAERRQGAARVKERLEKALATARASWTRRGAQ